MKVPVLLVMKVYSKWHFRFGDPGCDELNITFRERNTQRSVEKFQTDIVKS